LRNSFLRFPSIRLKIIQNLIGNKNRVCMIKTCKETMFKFHNTLNSTNTAADISLACLTNSTRWRY
jgi:hypothetical protein